MRALFAVVIAGLAGSCSAILDFDQCQKDSDCARFMTADNNAYCTADHICVSDFPSDRICSISPASKDTPDAITIAGLFRLSGPNDVLDTDISHAAELAVTEINQQGVSLRLVLCDTGGDPAQAKKAMSTAAEKYGAVAGVGPTSSSEVVALSETPDFLVKKYDFLVVSCSSTAPRVTSLDDDGLIWRTSASDNLQAKVLATLVPPTTTKAATAYIDSTYGSGLKDAFAGEVGLIAPGLIPTSRAFGEGRPGSEVVGFLVTNAPQVALIVADSDAPTWVGALNMGGGALMSTQYLLTDGSKAPTLFANNPTVDVVNRIKGTAPATPSGPAFDTFKGTFTGTYGKDPTNTAFVSNSYDATYAIALALGAIPVGAKVTGHAIAAGMTQLSDPNGLSVKVGNLDFGLGYDRLASGGTINLQGTSGPIDFDPTTGDILNAPIEIWGVDTTPGMGTGSCGVDASGDPICPFTTVKVCDFKTPTMPCPP